jgi:hypothetical protein
MGFVTNIASLENNDVGIQNHLPNLIQRPLLSIFTVQDSRIASNGPKRHHCLNRNG